MCLLENKGQFFEQEKADVGKPILYSTRKGKLHLYFSSSAITFRYDSIIPGEAEDETVGKKASLAKPTLPHNTNLCQLAGMALIPMYKYMPRKK